MSSKQEKVFISYSWDSDEHQEWIAYLVRSLRMEGYAADFDRNITANSTVNLNRMMVEQIKDNDFVILVVTEKYAERADSFSGGVGVESELLLSVVKNSRDKIILIIKQPGISPKKVPFYLEGFHYFDFSGISFKDSFEELIHRLQKTPKFDIGEVGEKRLRQSIIPNVSDKDLSNKYKLPSINKLNDLGKSRIMNVTFEELIKNINEICDAVSEQNEGFEYEKSESQTDKLMLSFYIHGRLVHRIKIWLGSFGGSSQKNIQYSFGNDVIFSNDNSMNGFISLEENQNSNQHYFTFPMDMRTSNKKLKSDELAHQLYESAILPYLK